MKRHAAHFVIVILALAFVSCSGRSTESTALSPTTSPTSEARTTTPEARATSTTTPGAREAVILVHGWVGSPRDFTPMKTFLDARGFRSFIAILPGEDNVENAYYLRGLVAEVKELTGVDKVNVVGFSMGGLSLRYYIRFLGGDSEVKRYVSIDTPQYGDFSACALPDDFGGQMCPGSSFLDGLNRGDDAPGDVAYTTLINRQGGGDSGRLRGGSTAVTVDGPHSDLVTLTSVQQAVLAALRG